MPNVVAVSYTHLDVYKRQDMAYTATWLNYSSLAQKGAFKALDELWPKYAPKNFERQSETALTQATVGDHYYCIPTLLATYSAFGPIYRTDLLKDTDWDGKMDNLADYCLLYTSCQGYGNAAHHG